jgi:hypothetical protein
MDINNIRIINLKRIIAKDYGNSIHQFAKEIGRHSSQFYNLFKGDRSFGQKLARDLELCLHLSPLALDKSPNEEIITDKIVILSHYNTNIPNPTKIDNHIFPIEKSIIETHGWPVNKLYGIIMDDESMLPTITPGSKVLIDTSQTKVDNGKIYAISKKNKILIKRVFHKLGNEVYEAKPDNKQYEEIQFKTDSDVNIIGRVLCLLTHPL